MKRLLALCALLSLALALPAVAPAKKKGKHAHHRTTVLKGSFRAIGADGAYTDKKFGKAQLVDNRKRDKLSVHLRRLAPRTTYTFALYSVAKGQPRCQEGASGGTQETAFAPKSKRTNQRGNLNAKQRSKTFKADTARSATSCSCSTGAQPVACAKLNGKKAKRGCKAGPKHPAKPHGEKPAKPTSGASGQAGTRRSPRSRRRRARTRAKRGCTSVPTRGKGGPAARRGFTEEQRERGGRGRPVLAPGYPSEPMYTVLSVVQVFIAVGLIFLILLHSGKDAGMSGAFGVGTGGGSSVGGSLMERNLDRWTIIFAVLFVLNTFALLKI